MPFKTGARSLEPQQAAGPLAAHTMENAIGVTWSSLLEWRDGSSVVGCLGSSGIRSTFGYLFFYSPFPTSSPPPESAASTVTMASQLLWSKDLSRAPTGGGWKSLHLGLMLIARFPMGLLKQGPVSLVFRLPAAS